MKHGFGGRNEVRKVVAATMTEDELEMAVRGTPQEPGLARRCGWLVYHTRRSKGSDPGFPDEVFVRGDRLLFVELKTEKGRLSPDQKDWAAALQPFCTPILSSPLIEYYLWRPSDWFDGTIERILK